MKAAIGLLAVVIALLYAGASQMEDKLERECLQYGSIVLNGTEYKCWTAPKEKPVKYSM